jgi:hypothetical protein
MVKILSKLLSPVYFVLMVMAGVLIQSAGGILVILMVRESLDMTSVSPKQPLMHYLIAPYQPMKQLYAIQ